MSASGIVLLEFQIPKAKTQYITACYNVELCVCLHCRIVGEEEKTGRVQQHNEGLQRQVQQLEAALQELGQEHQTLQVTSRHTAII